MLSYSLNDVKLGAVPRLQGSLSDISTLAFTAPVQCNYVKKGGESQFARIFFKYVFVNMSKC